MKLKVKIEFEVEVSESFFDKSVEDNDYLLIDMLHCEAQVKDTKSVEYNIIQD